MTNKTENKKHQRNAYCEDKYNYKSMNTKNNLRKKREQINKRKRNRGKEKQVGNRER